MKRIGFLLLSILLALAFAACDDMTDNPESDTDAAGDNPAADDDDDNETDDRGAFADCEPVAPVPWPAVDTADPSVIDFDEDLFFTVDGQKFFPLGFYSTPSDLAGLQAFKAEGFNIALTGPSCCGGTTLQDQIDVLEAASEAGVMIILRPWRPMSQVMTRPEVDLQAELDARTGIGSLFGWYTYDEPGLWNVPLDETARAHEVLTTYAPNHPDALVDAPLSDFERYVDDCSFFMVDPYPSDWMPLSYIKSVMIEATEATQGTKPIVGVMQAFSWDWINGLTEREYHPNALEMRNMTWQFIIHGARGLLPWNYAGDYTIRFQEEIWTDFLVQVAELNELMRVLLTPESEVDLAPSTTFPLSFDYSVKQEETATWIFTVSTNEHSLDVTLDLSSLGADLCIVDYTTGEVFIQDENGKIDVRYNRRQYRVLEVFTE